MSILGLKKNNIIKHKKFNSDLYEDNQDEIDLLATKLKIDIFEKEQKAKDFNILENKYNKIKKEIDFIIKEKKRLKNDSYKNINEGKILINKIRLENENLKEQINNKNEKNKKLKDKKNIESEKKGKNSENKEDKTLNINISNLTISCLYPIFIRWSESYKRLNEIKENKQERFYGETKKIKEKENKEKKMKISNHTLYNYTGKQIILDNNFQNSEDNIENYGDNQNDDDYIDFNHLNQYKEFIDDRKSYDIEYRDIVDKEDGENQIYEYNENLNYNLASQYDNKYNNTIKINLKECKLKENEIKVDKISTKKLIFKPAPAPLR